MDVVDAGEVLDDVRGEGCFELSSLILSQLLLLEVMGSNPSYDQKVFLLIFLSCTNLPLFTMSRIAMHGLNQV